MNKEKIAVTRSSMPPMSEYFDEIASLWESRWLTNMGAKHQAFEKALVEYLDVSGIALYTNGHAALECAFEAFSFPSGAKVITTPFTFASTTHAIVRKGLAPVFADIKESDYTIDPESVRALVDDDVCAIVPVHVYGNLCDTEAIQEIADEFNLKVIYDAAHAFGVRKGGVSAASYGDASMFSFHATKVFNTIEGGALCFKDESLLQTLNQWKNFGITGAESVEYVGGNAKMNEFCAAMGLCNLRYLGEEIAKRKIVADRYFEKLGDIEGVRVCPPQEGVEHNYAYLPVLFEESFGATRDEVFEALEADGIVARKYFYPLINDFECYRDRFDSASTPTAKRIASQVLTLPMYADLPIGEVDRICRIVLSCKR